MIHGFFRKLLSKDEKSKTLKAVDESEICVVNVKTLRCPICLGIYRGIPKTLTCGHTYCHKCIEDAAHAEFINDPRERNRNILCCPICRKRSCTSKSVNNYSLKSVLDSINEMAEEEEKSRKAFDNTVQTSNEQLRFKCSELEQTVNQLRREICEMRQKEKHNYVAISFFFIVYILLSTLFGN
ncbi:unnamed protein product [Caenorhabditis bovis]|uniref:RING-type domain-containing protein n=1 Tax=Caenorhabditis bovis TaxID=2654633 RepID=A0A8S1ENY6_9PELO|nr:unnamed protein product [Caenorhabditis bovis]